MPEMFETSFNQVCSEHGVEGGPSQQVLHQLSRHIPNGWYLQNVNIPTLIK